MSDSAVPTTFWFMNGHVTVHLSNTANPAGLSITEHLLPQGFGPPYHIHHDEDETFYVLAGQLRVKQADTLREAGPGEAVYLQRGIPHGFKVISPEGSRLLIVSTGRFEDMMRAASRPAPSAVLPEPEEPSPEMQAHLAAVCSANGIDLLGPPID
jgi:quercetin dioxygenase-like cupin family protein